MECPHCKNTLSIPNHAELNMQHYENNCTTITLCCNKYIRCHPVFSYTVEEAHPNIKRDDWGI